MVIYFDESSEWDQGLIDEIRDRLRKGEISLSPPSAEQLIELRAARVQEQRPLQVAIAGSHAQYRNFCARREINPRELRYVSRPERLRGLRGCRLIKIGTWYENRAMRDEVWELERAGYFSEVKSEDEI